MKCIRCNKMMLGAVKLADGKICMKCFKELGFDPVMKFAFDTVPYDQIKNGSTAYLAYCRERDKEPEDNTISVTISHYGEERELVCTEEERQIYNNLRDIFDCHDLNERPLRLVRVSDNYVTAKYNDWDLVRFKYTQRAKWLMFPTTDSEKHYIEDPDDIYSYVDDIVDSLDHISKYS